MIHFWSLLAAGARIVRVACSMGNLLAKPFVAVSAFCIALLSGMLSPVFAVSADMSADEVLASGCASVPGNFSLSEFWDSHMQVLEVACNYPAITESDIDGRRKPQAFAHGSENRSHDIDAVKVVNGIGQNGDTLGVAPRTQVSLGLYCTDPSPLLSDARPGDAAFSLRTLNSCSITSDLLPTIPVFGMNNQDVYVGSDRNHHGIQISSGANYGHAIDYFSPGGGIGGGGSISFALPEFAGIITALNAALISSNHAVLDNTTIKQVLDESSDKVYLEVDGSRAIYTEDQLSGLSSYKYYGQLVNLSNAISNILGSAPELMFLTFINEVNNDNGGNALISDFTLRVIGGVYDDVINDVARFSGDYVTVEKNVAYTISADPLPGYDMTGVECKDDDTNSVIAHPVSLSVGQSATCTVSHDDIAPKITVIKQVTNEDEGILGATDFDLYLSGQGVSGSIIRTSGETITVQSNTPYTLREDPVPGYSQTGIVCTDNDGGANLGHPVTLSEGQEASCTISNIDRDDSSMFVIPLGNGKAVIFDL